MGDILQDCFRHVFCYEPRYWKESRLQRGGVYLRRWLQAMHKQHSSQNIRPVLSFRHADNCQKCMSMRLCNSGTCVVFCAVQLYAASQLAGHLKLVKIEAR